MELPALYLRRSEERRLRLGHPWVFSNEVDVTRSPLVDFSAGQTVEVRAHNDAVLGSAYVNPQTLISARLFSRRAGQRLNRALISHRIGAALALRQRLFDTPFYRLVFGESDGLPGLVVDRYGDLLVVQIGTAGMERVKEDVLAVLKQALSPAAVVLRNDSSSRELEGLPSYVETWLGPESSYWELQENGVRFRFSPVHGQKTGWFLDHRLNRARLCPYVEGARVLDVFSYLGAWGVQAAVWGATQVVCTDASRHALDNVEVNADLNGVSGRVTTLEGDAFKCLKRLAEDGQRFDVIVVDPPAFIKRKKDIRSGTEAYQRLNRLAMRLLDRDGFLVSSSCSYRLTAQMLGQLLWGCARHLDRRSQFLEHGHQSPDHPVHPALPETAYLKTITARICR